MKNVLRLLSCVAIFTLSACATTFKPMEVNGLERSESVAVRDVRPEDEKDAKLFSFLITSKAYGIRRVQHESMSPSALRVLQHQVFEKMGTKASGLVVHHFVVYLNEQQALRRVALQTAFVGAAGAMFAGSATNDTQRTSNFIGKVINSKKFEATLADEYERALYTADEAFSNPSVYAIYIDAEVGGKRVAVRGLAPATGNELAPAMLATINYWVGQLPSR